MTTIIDKIAWIYLKDNKILCTRSKGKEMYYMPGGKREAGEQDEQTLIREIKEELDVDLHAETITYVGTYEAPADGKAEGVTVKMTCYTAEYEGQLKAENEIEELAWLGYSDIERISAAGRLIVEQLHEQGLLK